VDAYAKLTALVELAESVGITVRHMPPGQASAEHPGGAMVRLKDKEVLFLDPGAPAAEQIGLVASALKGRRQIEDRFVPPELREAIEETR